MSPIRPAIALLLLSAFPSSRLPAQVPGGRLTKEIRAAVIDTVAAQLGRVYVEADTGLLIGANLKKRLAAGAYDALENPGQFAEMVTRDLRAINGDLHLGLAYSPTPPRPGGGPGGFGDPAKLNFGMGKVEILDGNVGYLEITGFLGMQGYQDVAVQALRFLERTEAIIIDLRRNGGGSGEMSHFIFSHFLGATPVNTITVRRRAPAEPKTQQSLATVPGPRRTDVPLYLLTSQNTASAAEEFTFVLKNQKRVTVVGSRTAGAGHMVNQLQSGYGFAVGISITRVSDPATGREWEGSGVTPDIDVAPERALTEAHAAALRKIVAMSPDSVRLHRLLVTLDAKRNPVDIDAGSLAKLAGTYEGRQVAFAGGKLTYARRTGGLGEELTPLGGNRFALGATQFIFETEGGATRLVVEQPNGVRLTLKKS
jgi:hypothetical protein